MRNVASETSRAKRRGRTDAVPKIDPVAQAASKTGRGDTEGQQQDPFDSPKSYLGSKLGSMTIFQDKTLRIHGIEFLYFLRSFKRSVFHLFKENLKN